MRNYYLV